MGLASDQSGNKTDDLLVKETSEKSYFQDRRSSRRQDGKRPKQGDKRKGDNKPETKQPASTAGKKPEIKEVPKSIPKLKPKSVTEKVRIKRLPVKVKPRGHFRVF